MRLQVLDPAIIVVVVVVVVAVDVAVDEPVDHDRLLRPG